MTTSSTIEQRLTRLERSNRFFRRTAICAILILGFVILIGADAPKLPMLEADQIKCRFLTVTDKAGTPVVTVGGTDDGSGIIMVGSNNEGVAITHAFNEHGSSIEFIGDGKLKMKLLSDKTSQVVGLGTPEDTNSLQILRRPEDTSVTMFTLDRKTITLASNSAGGAAVVSAMDGASYAILGKGAANVQLDNRQSPTTRTTP